MFRTYFHFASFAPSLGKLHRSKVSTPSKSQSSTHNSTVRVIRTLAEFEALENDWNSLFERCKNNNQPFQSFAWHDHWCRAYLTLPKDDPSRLHIITLWEKSKAGEEDVLVALWPMQIKRFVGRNHLHFMGDPVSQYGDILIDKNANAHAILHQSWQYIVKNLDVDLLVLRKVKQDASIFPLLKDLDARRTHSEQGLYIDHTEYKDYAHYKQKFKPKEHKNRRRKLRRLENHGAVSISFLTAGNEASAMARQAIQLKRQWIEKKGLLSKAFQQKEMESFFASIALADDEHVRINLSVLHVGNKPAAITIGFGAKNYQALHINVIDLAFEKDSPGVALLEKTIEHSMAQDNTVLDFLAPADNYKSIWCNQMKQTDDFSLATNQSGALYAVILLKLVRHGGKVLLDTMPSRIKTHINKIVTYSLWHR